MKKIIILGLGVAAFFMQGCDFLDRTPEDIIETGKSLNLQCQCFRTILQ